ncbi:MAG: hypothetical protein LBS92_01205, partial [Candidatus Methanoplasma sp.]|nr:hypothetical protein [Candidatus Methanoplasma sp.]
MTVASVRLSEATHRLNPGGRSRGDSSNEALFEGGGGRRLLLALALAAIAVSAVLIVINDENVVHDSDAVPFAGGDGTAADPYIISTYAQLNGDFRTTVGVTGGANPYGAGLYFELGADIALVGNWTPIPGFRGSFDGDGHHITGLTIVATTWGGHGLFATSEGTIKNLNLTVEGIQYNGTTSNNSNENASIGGLVGYGSGTIENVRVTLNGDIISNTSDADRVGGIVGLTNPVSSEVYNTPPGYAFGSSGGLIDSSVTGTGSVSGGVAGGVVGESRAATIKRSYSTVDVTGSTYAGGFAGLAWSPIEDSFATGNVSFHMLYHQSTSFEMVAGGFAGLSSSGTAGSLVRSYSTGNVNISGDFSGFAHVYVGGFVGFGQIFGYIENCYTRAESVTVTDTGGAVTLYAGGFIGTTQFGMPNVYSTASTVTATSAGGGTTYAGGFIGNASGSFGGAFYDSDLYGGSSAGGGTVTGVTGKTTAEMKTSSTFTGASWDFTTVWRIDSTGGVNDGYPYLAATPKVAVSADAAGGYTVAADTFEYSVNSSGAWTQGSTASVPVGETVSFRVKTAAPGYAHSYWTQGSAIVAYNTATVTAPAGGTTVTAHFIDAADAATLTARAFPQDAGAFAFRVDGGATFAYTGPVTVLKSSTISLTASPATGYAFSTWSGGYGAANPASISMSAGDVSVTAAFKSSADASNANLSLTASPSAGGGFQYELKYADGSYTDVFAMASGGTARLPQGTVIRTTAVPSATYRFVEWNNLSTSAAREDTLTSSNLSLTATFVQGIFVTAAADPSGAGTFTFSVNGAAHSAQAGDQVKLLNAGADTVSITAAPTGANAFLYWTQGAGAAPISFSATLPAQAPSADTTYTAHFTSGPTVTVNGYYDASRGKVQFALALGDVPVDGAPISGGGSVTVASGTAVYVHASPLAGHQFSYWAKQHGGSTAAMSAADATDPDVGLSAAEVVAANSPISLYAYFAHTATAADY